MKRKDAKTLALKKWPKVAEVRKLTMTMNEALELQRRAFVEGVISNKEEFNLHQILTDYTKRLQAKGFINSHKAGFEFVIEINDFVNDL